MNNTLSAGTLRAYRAAESQIFIELALLEPAGFEPDPHIHAIATALKDLMQVGARTV